MHLSCRVGQQFRAGSGEMVRVYLGLIDHDRQHKAETSTFVGVEKMVVNCIFILIYIVILLLGIQSKCSSHSLHDIL